VELTPEIGMSRRQSWRPHLRKQHIGPTSLAGTAGRGYEPRAKNHHTCWALATSPNGSAFSGLHDQSGWVGDR